jgi:hypothetical protein
MKVSAYLSMEQRATSPFYRPTGHVRAGGFADLAGDSKAGQGWLLFQRADDAGASGVYYPEALKSMCMAFDLAWEHVSWMFEDQEKARRILAVQVLHHADRGEHNVGRLATSATDDLIALTGVSGPRHSRISSTLAKASVKRTFADYRALRQM